MNMTLLRRAALAIAMVSIGASAYCQDLIARQAPVDRRLRAVDSVAIQRAVDRDMDLDLSSDVYNTWVTNRAHPYKREDVPESYRIDLPRLLYAHPLTQCYLTLWLPPRF